MQDRDRNGNRKSPAGTKLTFPEARSYLLIVAIVTSLFFIANNTTFGATGFGTGIGTGFGTSGGGTQNCNNQTTNGPGPSSQPAGATANTPNAIVHGTGQSCPNPGNHCKPASGCGGGSGCTGDFFYALGSAESNDSYSTCNTANPPCCGWIQFCGSNLTTAKSAPFCSATGVFGMVGYQSATYNFNNNVGSCQDKAIISYTQGNWNTLLAIGMGAYLCKPIVINGVTYNITQGGLLGAANLCGPGNVKAWIQSGINGTDMYGTSCSQYFLDFNATYIPTNVSWSDQTCPVQNPSCPTNSPPPPPPPKNNYTGPCGDPVLTGNFAKDPCGLAKPPTANFPTYINNWWNSSLLPAMKDMTTQLYTYRIWETWELGRMMDAVDATRAAHAEQQEHLASHQGITPTQSVCVEGSAVTALDQTQLTAIPLTEGFVQDMDRRLEGVDVKQAGSPLTYAHFGSANGYDIANRWDQYCKEFLDLKSNDGVNICPGNPSSNGPAMNDDINVEGFLLQDTLDLNNKDIYAGAQAMPINLIEPFIPDRVPTAVINTPQGEEYIIRLQHLEAINNIAATVVGGIISRRAALPPTDTAMAAKILELRTSVGIPACTSTHPPGTACASATPSYNEIMDAMTQERFYDPRYFTRVENDIGAIKQEQASIDAYTTVQMQDIYQLQEQINALLAARAALKLNVQANSNSSESAPEK